MNNERAAIAGCHPHPLAPHPAMARWPKHMWTTLFTYGAIFLLFPLLAWLAYAYVNGQLF